MTANSPEGTAAGRNFDQKRLGRLIVGIVALATSIGYLIQALSIERGTIDAPGPGMFPIGVGAAAIVVSIIVIAEGLAGTGTRGSLELPTGFERRKVLIFFGTLVAFIAVLPLLGMYVSAALYVVATLKLLGYLRWIRSIVIGVLIAVVVSWVFQEILDVPLPAGLW